MERGERVLRLSLSLYFLLHLLFYLCDVKFPLVFYTWDFQLKIQVKVNCLENFKGHNLILIEKENKNEDSAILNF